MKYLALIALSGLAQVQQASALCCRTNKCLKAVVAASELGLAECAAKLTVTITPEASIFHVTATAVESAITTSLSYETTTETDSTETVLSTEFSTITSTETGIVSSTTTVPITETTTETLAPVYTTIFSYAIAGPTRKVKARKDGTLGELEGEVPAYAFDVCGGDFQKYAKACGCAGVEVVTVTAKAEVVTVTVPGSTVTDVYSTYLSTETSTDLVTATTSSTVTDITSVTDTVTSTTIVVASSTAIVAEQSTPTSVTAISCKAKGSRFWATVLQTNDGSTRYLTHPGFPAWQMSDSNFLTNAGDVVVWLVSAGGWLENAAGLAAYIETSEAATDALVRVWTKPKAEVDAGVTTGIYARIAACVTQTNQVLVSGLGRENMFNCGNAFYISSDHAESQGSYCVQLFPTTIDR